MTDLLPELRADLVASGDRAQRRASRRRAAVPAVTVLAAASIAAVFVVAGPHRASTDAPARSTGATGTVPPQTAQLQRLEDYHSPIDVSRAELLTPGASVQLWLGPSRNGRDLCLANTSATDVGVACVAAAKARRIGIVSGVPGGGFGWVPPTARPVTGASAAGARVTLPVRNGTFRVPAGLRTLSLGGTPKRYLPQGLLSARQARPALTARYAVLRSVGAKAAAQGISVTATLPGSRTTIGLSPSSLGELCIRSTPSVRDSCISQDDAAVGVPLVAATQPGGRSFGLLPDGIPEVRLRFADGTFQTVPVQRNLWSAATKTPPTSVEWTDRSGARWTSGPFARP